MDSGTAPYRLSKTPIGGMVALGVKLALSGRGSLVGRVVSAAITAVFVVSALAVSKKGVPDASLVERASTSLAWGGGMIFLVLASTRALAGDLADGVVVRARASGVSTTEYVLCRTVGLVLGVAALLLGSELLVVAASLGAAHGLPSVAWGRASVAAIAYLVLFAVTLGLLAMALLASRVRTGGYFTFLFVIVGPELIARSLAEGRAHSWQKVLSIPDALEAVRRGVETGVLSNVAPALLVLAAVVVVSGAIVVWSRSKLDVLGAA